MWRSKWLLLFLALVALAARLIQLNQPFIDPWSWRQADVAAIARNYFENGFHFCWPQIDWAGDAPGYVGTEFPILPFIAGLTYKITGVQEWVGRIQGVLFFVIGLPFFFLFIRRIFGEVAAAWATFFYAFAPLSLVASRAFMPDVPSLSLTIIGTYFFLRWLEENGWRFFVASAVLISLGLLIKLPNGLIGVSLLYLVIVSVENREISDQKPALQRLVPLIIFALITLLPSAIWYWHAYHIAETFYPYHFFGADGVRIMSVGWSWKIVHETVFSSLTPVLSLLAIAGAFIVPRGRYSRVFHWWFATMILFIIIVGWGNRHQWYQLPLVPIAAAFAGCACQLIWIRLRHYRVVLAVGSLILAVAFGISSYQRAQPFYRSSAAALWNLGLELKEATTSDALIIAADDGDPTAFYYAHRKGWHLLGDGVFQGTPVDSAQAIANFEKLRGRGATHLVFCDWTQWWLKYYPEFAEHLAKNATLMEQTSDFTIYKLEATQ